MNRHDRRAARRRSLGLLLGGAAGIVASAYAQGAPADAVLRVGYQKYGTLTLLKGRGTLEKRLAAQGIAVRWTQVPAGPALLEALNVGSIDLGSVGEAPPIFALAAGANFVYVANEPPSPGSEAIVVGPRSTLRTVAALKGKTVALNRGSNVHFLLVKALEKAGLAYADIRPVFLAPADARAAFERGSVDAWAIWDPFLAAAEKQLGARILVDGRGLVSNREFYLAARPYADRHRDVVRLVVEELAATDAWGRAHPGDVATILTAQTGLDAGVVTLAAQRFAFGTTAVTAEVLREQQAVADAFAALKLIPKPIAVRAAQLPFAL